MRADATRNTEKLRTAAVEVFGEKGLNVSLREIARRAGVSHGTLYNLYGSREALINEVVTDLAAGRLEQIAADSLSFDDPWDGFAHYVETVCEVQASDPALADVLSGRYPEAETLMALCARASSDAVAIIERAQQAGSLRPDFTGEDLALTVGAVAALARAGAGIAPNAWRRSAAIVLDGLRSDAAKSTLPDSALTAAQVYSTLNGLSGATTAP